MMVINNNNNDDDNDNDKDNSDNDKYAWWHVGSAYLLIILYRLFNLPICYLN